MNFWGGVNVKRRNVSRKYSTIRGEVQVAAWLENKWGSEGNWWTWNKCRRTKKTSVLKIREEKRRRMVVFAWIEGRRERERRAEGEAPSHFGRRDRRLTMSLDTYYVASWDSTSHHYHPSLLLCVVGEKSDWSSISGPFYRNFKRTSHNQFPT